MLEKVSGWNDLSPALRKKLDAKIDSLGKKVRFKFDIKKKNPDPEKKQGEWLYPFIYTLDPITFNITDTLENTEIKGRETAQRFKKIGIVEAVKENGEPDRFRRIRVHEMEREVLTFDTTKAEDRENIAYLLLHPKLSGGEYADKEKLPVVTLIDEQKTANEERAERTARKKAMDAAEEMNDKEVLEFADAMSGGNSLLWDSTQEPSILRNEIEKLAEKEPKFFNDLVEGKAITYQAVIQKALNKSIVSYDPGEMKFMWASTGQVIQVLSPVGDKNEIEKFAEILMTGGSKSDELYKRIKGLVEPAKTTT